MRRAGVLLLVFTFFKVARSQKYELKKQGISPARFAGGHGSIADYAPLAALEGK